MKSRTQILWKIGDLQEDLKRTEKWMKIAQKEASETVKKWNMYDKRASEFNDVHAETLAAINQTKEIKAMINLLNWVID